VDDRKRFHGPGEIGGQDVSGFVCNDVKKIRVLDGMAEWYRILAGLGISRILASGVVCFIDGSILRWQRRQTQSNSKAISDQF